MQTCRRELLNRTLIWNKHHLLYALHEYETHYNSHRAHQAMEKAAPLHAVPAPNTDPQHITDPRDPPTRPTRLHHPRIPTRSLTLPGRHYRQAQLPVSTICLDDLLRAQGTPTSRPYWPWRDAA